MYSPLLAVVDEISVPIECSANPTSFMKVKILKGSDDRRRTEPINSVKTLDGLAQELLKIEFDILRSETYLRLIPSKKI